jgi:hypothetical protein
MLQMADKSSDVSRLRRFLNPRLLLQPPGHESYEEIVELDSFDPVSLSSRRSSSRLSCVSAFSVDRTGRSPVQRSPSAGSSVQPLMTRLRTNRLVSSLSSIGTRKPVESRSALPVISPRFSSTRRKNIRKNASFGSFSGAAPRPASPTRNGRRASQTLSIKRCASIQRQEIVTSPPTSPESIGGQLSLPVGSWPDPSSTSGSTFDLFAAQSAVVQFGAEFIR